MTSWFNLLTNVRYSFSGDPPVDRWSDSILRSRWLVTLLVMPLVAALSADLWAVSPERFPEYSHAQAMREDATLRAIAFSDPQLGLACGDRGTILRTDDGGQSWEIQASGVDCQLNDLLWVDDRQAIIVGGGYDRVTQIGRAVILMSQDGGRSWQPLSAADLPVLSMIDRGRDGRLTVAGDWSHAMSTDRFQSHDSGSTWIADFRRRDETKNHRRPKSEPMARWVAATGVPVAIRDACRIGDSTLMAVGDHGVILASRDGGRTWESSRGSGRRTSVLIVARDRTTVAWGMLGKEAIEHRNRVVLLLDDAGRPEGSRFGHRGNANGDRAAVGRSQNSPNQNSPNQNSPNQRDETEVPAPGLANQVAVMLGAAGADQAIPVGSDVHLAAQQWISIHRPSVLVLDQTLDAAVREAFVQAATSAGVARVAVYHRGSGPTVIHRDAMLPVSGVLVSDLASDAYQFVAPRQAPPRSIAIQFDYDVASSGRHGGSVTGGIRLTEGQRLASRPSATSRRRLQVVQARRTQSTRIKTLIDQSSSPNQFSETLRTVLDQTAREDQFRLAWTFYIETAGRDGRQGKGDTKRSALRQEVLTEIADRFPSMSASQWARLIQRAQQHSTEWQHLNDLISQSAVELTTAGATVPVSPFQDVGGPVIRQAAAITPVISPKPELHDLNRPAPAEVQGVDLAWEYHPAVLIAREASRLRGDDNPLQSIDTQSTEIKRLAQSSTDRWATLVRSDSAHRIVARATNTPPKLDGILDDPCWDAAASTARPALNTVQPALNTIKPAEADADPPRLQIRYDDEFLYVGYEVSATRMRPDSDASPTDQRSRDRDLDGVDRFQLRIDVDRDLLTSYRFAVSASGQTYDAIDDHPIWDPTWYRQTRTANGRQTIELAILRRDLVDLPIPIGERWYISARTLVAHGECDPLAMPDPAHWLPVEFR